MESKKLILVLTVFMTPATLGFKIPDLTSYYQDLTDPIDKIVFENDKTNFTHHVLEAALNRSVNVYYSTDVRMNNIEDIFPVIKLLNETKPEKSSRLSILLSLRFTHKNRFSRPDYDDVFYDLGLNLSDESWKAIFASVDHIAIDMTTEDCSEASFFYSKPGLWSLEQPLMNFSFPYFVKNFISFYKELKKERKDIYVGIAYNSSQIGCADYLQTQIENSDFFMITHQFSPYKGFPFTQKSLRKSSEQVQRKHYNTFLQRNDDLRFCDDSKNFFYILQMNEMPTSAEISSKWNYNMNNLLSSSSFYAQSSKSMIERMYWTNMKLFLSRRSDSEVYHYSNNKCYMVLGNSVTGRISNVSRDDIKSFKPGAIIPTVVAKEYKFDICTAQLGFSRVQNGSFLVDQYAWRAMARFESIFLRGQRCYNGYYDPGQVSGSRAILLFQRGISKQWPTIEKNMDILIEKHKNIANFTLKTIAFHDEDILPLKYETTVSNGYDVGYSQISYFLGKWDHNFSTGCVVDFTVERINSIEEGGGRFSEKMRRLCEPVFDLVDLLIWDVPNDNSVGEGYSGKHDDVLLAREIFLAEFPDKQVFLRLDYDIQFEVVSEWSKLYGVPVIFKN